VIDYVTDPKKAIIVSSQALDDNQSYTKQFMQTCGLYGKGNKSDERKYYHFKLSCNPTDNPTPQQSHALAERLAQELFADYECVIGTHADTDTMHTHIVVNAVSFETGKKLHMNNTAYRHSKDLANALGAEMGLSTLDWRAKTKEKRERSKSGKAITSEDKYLSSAERNMGKGGNLAKDSWKEALRHAIDEAKAHCTDRADFQRYLYDTFGVTMPRNTAKTVTFIHPAVGETYAVRGNKLGADYTAASIDQALQQNKSNLERSVLNARLFTTAEHTANEQTAGTTTTAPTAWADPSTAPHANTIPHDPISPSQRQRQKGHGERIVARSISDISEELRRIDKGVQDLASGGQSPNVVIHGENDADGGGSETRNSRPIGGVSRTDKPERPEPPRPVVEHPAHDRPIHQEPPKPEPVVQQQPKRRSYNRGR